MNPMSFDPLFFTHFVFKTVSFFNSVNMICFSTTQIRNSCGVVSKGKDGPDLNFGSKIHVFFFLAKGQLILKCPFGVFKSTKNPTNFL